MIEGTVLEQYHIADFVEWFDEKKLLLNPYFQRRKVWTRPAQVYLIDTILRNLPMPKIYLRTKIDTATRRSYREVVDGQQRLNAIFAFVRDEFALSSRAGQFRGLRFSTLDEELQQNFLSYSVAVDQLLNASDSDVLEVFARLNSYTVALVPAEKRHAKYQGPFKWAAHEEARSWKVLWEELGVLSVRERLRMADDALLAEMLGILIRGVTDGGAPNIEKLYRDYDADFPDEDKVRRRLGRVLTCVLDNFSLQIAGSRLAGPPQFLMIFAAAASAMFGIPQGGIDKQVDTTVRRRIDIETAQSGLALLASMLESEDEEIPKRYVPFVRASTGSTQRISTRRVRFRYFLEAIGGREGR